MQFEHRLFACLCCLGLALPVGCPGPGGQGAGEARGGETDGEQAVAVSGAEDRTGANPPGGSVPASTPVVVSPSVPVVCPEDMVLVPGGSYLLGGTVELPPGSPEAERPGGSFWVFPNPARVHTVETFCIDRYEYPNKKGTLPMAMVTWTDAVRLCGERDRRLPTQLEWLAAAQGPGGFRYSYGEERRSGRCNTEVPPRADPLKSLVPSGSLPDCHSPLGVYDLNGNLSEWVQDLWTGPWFENWAWGGPEDEARVAMGGTMWKGDIYGQSSLSRHRHPPDQRWEDDGFRCASSPGPAP